MGRELYNLSWILRGEPSRSAKVALVENNKIKVENDEINAIILYPSLLTPALGFKGGDLEILLLVEKGKKLTADHVRNSLKIFKGLDKKIIFGHLHLLKSTIKLNKLPKKISDDVIELKNEKLKFAGILDARMIEIYKKKDYEDIYEVVIKEIDGILDTMNKKKSKPPLNRGCKYTVKDGDTLEKIYLDHDFENMDDSITLNKGSKKVWRFFEKCKENNSFMKDPVAKDQGDINLRTDFANNKDKRDNVIKNNQSGAVDWDSNYCRFVDKFGRKIIYAGETVYIPSGEIKEEQDNILVETLEELHKETPAPAPAPAPAPTPTPTPTPTLEAPTSPPTSSKEFLFEYCFKVKDDDVYMTEKDKANKVLSYHPFIYYDDKGSKDNKVFSIGHLTDLHLVSRQQVLAKSNARVIEYKTGNEDNKNENEEDKKKNEEDKKMMDKISPEIGTLVNIYSKNVLKLLRELGTKADAICITGDFIDHINDVYLTDKQFKEVKKASDVWNIVETNNKRYYKRFVDFVMAYSIILDFYKKYQKPVFAVTGNHDFYDKAYGISPRVRIIGVRANKGICADHNLTIYEGILAFGETYAETGDSRIANSIVNTRGDNLKWFYSVFTPFSNFSVTMPKQILTGFGWGDDESLAAAKFLPVSNESMSQGQMKLLKQVREESKKNDNKKVILFSHFTFASYADSISNQKKDGEIKFEDSQLNNEYTLGTFRYRRIDVYKLLTEKNKEEEEAIVTCVITGHSHRRGLYTLGDTSWWSNDIKTTFNDFNNTDNTGNTGNIKNHPAIIVSDSAGPLPRYNYDGEFSGWGSSNPSGTLITFNVDGSAANCKVVSLDIKPRIVVAIDYFDIVKKKATIKFKPIDSGNEMKDIKDFKFTLELDESIKKLGLKIENAHIFRIDNNSVSRVEFKNELTLAKIYEKNDTQVKNAIRYFVAIKFETATDKKIKHYNFDDYWAFEIKIKEIEKTERVLGTESPEVVGYSYEIVRDKRKAEIPDFKWRKKNAKYN